MAKDTVIRDIPDELLGDIDKMAAKEDRSRNYILLQLLDEAVAARKKVNK